jgi:hypothetical protein
MEKKTQSSLNPELIIGREEAIDRMGFIASRAVELAKPNYPKQIKLVRNYARTLCPSYNNCRLENWCWMCCSGIDKPLTLGKICLGCKLLTTDARLLHAPRLSQQDINDIT